MRAIQVPDKYHQYQWIAKRFSKIKNVEVVVMNATEDGLNLFVTNNNTGDKKKVFEFPLRRLVLLDYALAPNVPSPYDIMALDDPEPMVFLGECKAKQLFKD